MQLRHAAAIAVVSVTLAAISACSGGSATEIAGFGIDVSVGEVDDVRLDSLVSGVTSWRGGLLAVSAGGQVLRSSDSEHWVAPRVTGLATGASDDPDASTDEYVTGLAGVDGLLVAVGARYHTDDNGGVTTEPLVWRSRDGTSWELVATTGIAAPGVHASVDGVVAHRGELWAFGSWYEERSEEGDEEETADDDDGLRGVAPALWRSRDGATWERATTPGLANSSEYGVQSVEDVAARGSDLLAVQLTECADCFDDYTLGLWRSADGGAQWSRSDATGLDTLDAPNTDIVPVVVGLDPAFVALANGEDEEPVLFASRDGRDWDETGLAGPPGAVVGAVTAVDGAAVALGATESGRLVVWRIELG